uniref:Ig-like domain-containing protein n=1 Tax=Pygocentrus nattereri TaxID=42514 RepID=A0A3B4CUC4_PYGNA
MILFTFKVEFTWNFLYIHTTFSLSTVSGLLCSAGEEVVRLQELEGNTVTIHTGLTGVQSDAHILWFYGPENADIKIVNSESFEGKIITNYYSQRFRDRLQLNRTSGSLTIRNISREDSGVYKLQINTEKRSKRELSRKEKCSVNLLALPTFSLSIVSGLLCSAGEEVVRLQELEGNTVTIHTGLTGVQSDAHILWLYGPENADIKIVNSDSFEGKIITNYDSERFRDRLQLNRTSGSLTIRNISREDSGVYKLQINTKIRSKWSYKMDVYGEQIQDYYFFIQMVVTLCCANFLCLLVFYSSSSNTNHRSERKPHNVSNRAMCPCVLCGKWEGCESVLV